MLSIAFENIITKASSIGQKLKYLIFFHIIVKDLWEGVSIVRLVEAGIIGGLLFTLIDFIGNDFSKTNDIMIFE